MVQLFCIRKKVAATGAQVIGAWSMAETFQKQKFLVSHFPYGLFKF